MPLVISIKDDEEIIITHAGEKLVISTRRARFCTKVLFTAPKSFHIVRKEVLERRK